jgi:predicted permease
MSGLMQDMRYAVRGLRRSAGFTAVACLTLALGIGANAAIFSVVDAALLKPMSIPHGDRVVRISGSGPQSFVWFNPRGFELWPSFLHTTAFDAIGAYVTGELTVSGSERGRLRATAVTPEVFDVLKVAPLLGRVFTNADLNGGSFHVAVISHKLWQTHFHGSADVLSRHIVFEKQTFLVLGVMPLGFETPEATEVWVPSYWGGKVVTGRWLFPIVIARMARGVTTDQARDALLHTRWARAGWPPLRAVLEIAPLRDTLVGDMRPIILLLAAGAFIVLLVASTNVASLLLTRVSARHVEVAVRRALGASDFQIARQIVAETLLLSVLAFIMTVPIAIWTLDAIRAWVPIRMYGSADIAFDARSLAASAIFSLSTAVFFSAAPLWSARRGSSLAHGGASAATADSATAPIPQWPGGRRSRVCRGACGGGRDCHSNGIQADGSRPRRVRQSDPRCGPGCAHGGLSGAQRSVLRAIQGSVQCSPRR